MSILEGLTHDQIALIGCVAALSAAFGLTALVGVIRPTEDRRLQMSTGLKTRQVIAPESAASSERRAA